MIVTEQWLYCDGKGCSTAPVKMPAATLPGWKTIDRKDYCPVCAVKPRQVKKLKQLRAAYEAARKEQA